MVGRSKLGAAEDEEEKWQEAGDAGETIGHGRSPFRKKKVTGSSVRVVWQGRRRPQRGLLAASR